MSRAELGILGAGAVGHMLAFFLREKASIPLELWGRYGPLRQAHSVSWQGKTHSISLSWQGESPSLWFCALKAHALQTGLRQLLPKLKPGSQVIIVSNGYIETLLLPLRREFPDILLRKGLVSRGVKRSPAGDYVIGAEGQVLWGDELAKSSKEELILRELQNFGFSWDPDTCLLRREKWFCNTTLNTLCGVYHLASNGDALRFHGSELENLAREVYALMGEIWPGSQVKWEELWQKLLQLIASSSDNENSMAADVRFGRRTEADVLSGLVRVARDPARYPLLDNFNRRLAADASA